MKVLVCGGRSFTNRDFIFAKLDELHQEFPLTHLMTGGAKGADYWADEWALERGVQSVICFANWALYRRAAGPIRNRNMLALEPDLVVAFPGGTGTADMVSQARKAGFEVRVIE